jgi:phage I-like protein
VFLGFKARNMTTHKNWFEGGILNGIRLKEMVEINFVSNEKVKVSPIGQTVGLDGRGYRIDAKALIASVVANDVHIPLDENHSFGAAFGWFDKNSFEARTDGIYAALELTPDGAEALANKTYRYLSPVFTMGDNRAVAGLDSVGLVNRPNLLNNALNNKENQPNKKEKNEVDEKEVAQMKAKNEALEKELKEANGKLTEANAKIDELGGAAKETKIVGALEKNEILPAQADFARTLTGAHLDKFLEMNKKDNSHLTKETKKAGEKGGDALEANEIKIAKQMGLTPEAYAKYKEGN